MDADDKLLVEVLGAQDATWAPLRKLDWDSPHAAANLYAGRRDYASGIPWASGEPQEAERKAAQRSLETLAAAGMVKVFPRAGRTIGVVLTDAGEERGRALTDLPSVVESWLAVGALAAFGRPGDWIAETVLIANDRMADYTTLGRRAGRLLASNEAAFYPSLSRNFVVANSDQDGRVLLRLCQKPEVLGGLDFEEKIVVAHRLRAR